MLKVVTQYVPCFYDHLYSMNCDISYPIAKDYCTKNSLEFFLNGTLSHSLPNTNAKLCLDIYLFKKKFPLKLTIQI